MGGVNTKRLILVILTLSLVFLPVYGICENSTIYLDTSQASDQDLETALDSIEKELEARDYSVEIKVLKNQVDEVVARTFKVSISCKRTAYYHLGEDISYEHTFDGKVIDNGDTITVTGNTATFETTIVENDSIPDVGYGSMDFDLQNITKKTSQTMSITVYESGGRRYPDAYATWDVTYTLTPKK